MNVRPVKISYALQIAEIYNHYINTSTATFETEPIDAAEMAKRIGETVAAGYPFLAAEDDGQVIGYAYGHQYRAREAYRRSVEVSVYLKDGAGGKGIGTALYGRLFPELGARGFHTAIAGISLPNEASVRLHEKFGMTKVAHFKEVGFKFDRWIDTGFWQVIIER
jgi:L-amino acid N-acyltransferase YncA